MKVKQTIKRVILFIAVCLIIVLFYAYKIEPYWIEITEQPVYISNLPEVFEGFRIVQLSDLHGKRFSDNKIVNMVNRLRPDLVAITGDVFEESEHVPLDYVDTVFRGLTAKYGVCFVFGNNENYLNKQKVKHKLSELKIKTLLNETLPVSLEGKRIDIVGIDDLYSINANLSKALEGTGSEPKILLSHTPEVINLAVRADIDLVLSGHTHGGQIAIPFIPWKLANVSGGYKQFISGLHKVGHTQMYINRGLGENILNIRFLTRPEITVITLTGR